MSQVIVGTLIMETGCHIDGSHQSTLDFDLRVIHFAAEKTDWSLTVEDAQAVYDAEHGALETDGYAVISEIANDAVEYLCDKTQDGGWAWYVEDQSLILGSVFDLPDSV